MPAHLNGQPLHFPPDSFVAAGGEATVYGLGDIAYKVFHQPVDGARLRALAALSVPGALLPRRLLTDDAGAVIGHTMALLPDATPLARLLSRRFCRDHGFDGAARLRIVSALADLVRRVHLAGALVVDLHEGNILLDATFHPVLVDTSSWQLPGHPATALQDAIRDRHATGFHQGTDWFAFAVTAAQLLLGVHPYRGTHPTLKGLDERMQARVSVFDPAVRLPPVCPSPRVVPEPWRGWLVSVLDGAHRGPPPATQQLPVWLPASRPVGTRMGLTRLAEAPFPVATALEHGGRTVLIGASGIWCDERRLDPARAVTVTEDGTVVAARIQADGRLALATVPEGRPLQVSLLADDVRPLGTGFVVRSGPRLVELGIRHGLVLPRLLATVLPHATQLHDGLAVQDLAGACHLLLLSPGRCDARRVPDLDGWLVQHAQAARGAVAIVARKDGCTDRFLLRTAQGRMELRRTPDVDAADVDLVPLPTHPDGVALRVGARLELFRARPGHPDLRTVEDPILARGHLVALDGALGLLVGSQLSRLRPPAAPPPTPARAGGRRDAAGRRPQSRTARRTT